VRHGQTELNTSFKFAGSIDSELSPGGYKQIEKLRDRLADEKIDAVICSDLKRAKESAAIIAAGRQLELHTYPELRELNYGKLEGLTFGEIHHNYPDVSASIDKHDYLVNFPGGECFGDLEKRIGTMVVELKGYPADQTILVVTHGGPLRMLVCKLLETGVELWWRLRIDNASLTIIDMYPDGAILSLLNDVSHLNNPKS